MLNNKTSVIASPAFFSGTKQSLYALSLLIIFFVSSSFQQSAFKPVSNFETFKKQFSEASQKTVSVQSDFVQEKNLNMLSEKITSKGLFYFKKENKVRLEYQQPFQYLMVINGTKVLIKDQSKESKLDMQNNKLFQQINKIIIDCVQGTALSNPDFKIEALESDKEYKIVMIPVAKGMKDFFSSIYIFTDKKDFFVQQIHLNETGGDNTIINFTNKQLNAVIADEVFAVK